MSKSEQKRPLYIHYAGPSLLETPLLNKGSAFSLEERDRFNLTGLLPNLVETIEEQVERAYMQYSSYTTAIDKHVYLRDIQDTNETLFYRLVQDNLEEMMPIIYTPTVGNACELFSDIYRCARGLFISYEDRYNIDDILRNATKQKVKIVVVTDGERILGLGDQGMGGMGIPIGKLSLYTACGGISPAYTLPVMLDVGTNNETLLNNPMYMGWRHKRITGKEYDEFVDLFVKAIKRRWPEVLLQFEDFAQANATPLLERYRDEICCFNDDIQGTAAVTVGSLIAACKSSGTEFREQRVAFVGSGSAGCGIAEQIIKQMVNDGLTDEEARARVFMVDRFGLLTEDSADLRDFQEKLAQPNSALEEWSFSGEFPTLQDVINCAKPTILIGVSGQPGLFTENVITQMAKDCERPIIFPLSNPSHRIEATPQSIIEWTEGRAIVATGSPFEPVEYEGKTYPISQCNNSYIFPGLGLGVTVVGASRISDEMLMATSQTLAEHSPLATKGKGDLLPPLTEISILSKKIAFAVGKVAQEQGLALEIDDDLFLEAIEASYWLPEYRRFKRVSP